MDRQVAELAETALLTWAKLDRMRDELIRAAFAVGVPKNRIHVVTGVARSTIDRVLLHSGQST